MEEVHRVSVPKPQEGEKLGLTVQQQNKCVVVTRILSGGLVDQVGDLGQIQSLSRRFCHRLRELAPSSRGSIAQPRKNHFMVLVVPDLTGL